MAHGVKSATEWPVMNHSPARSSGSSKSSRRNVNVSLACGDSKMMALLGLTAIMFMLSMFFITKAMYPRPRVGLGDASVYSNDCARQQQYSDAALKKTVNELLTCNDALTEKKEEVESLTTEVLSHDRVNLNRRATEADLEAERKNISDWCQDLNTHHGALTDSYNYLKKHLQAQSRSLGIAQDHASISTALKTENTKLKIKDKTSEAIIDHLRSSLLKSEFHNDRKWIINQSVEERAFAEPDLSVYVYDLPAYSTDFFYSHVQNYEKRCKNQIGEHHLHNLFLNDTRTRVMDGEKADLYYVPVYTGCYRTVIGEELKMDAYDATYAYIQTALTKIKEMPYWERNQGRDHVWVFLYDYGVCLEYANLLAKTRTLPPGLEHSIMVGYVGDNTPGLHCYNTWKDVVIPAYIDNPTLLSAKGGEYVDPKMRTTLAYFRGSIKWPESPWHTKEMDYSNGVRERLHQLYSNDPLFSIFPESASHYVEEMKSSVFCLAPLGYSKWSFRFYEAIICGCIPVIIADEIELPYEDLLDYRSFTVKIRQDQVLYLKDMLLSIPQEHITKKQENLKRVWKHFVFNHPTKKGDAFDLLLDQLKKKVRKYQSASMSFWL